MNSIILDSELLFDAIMAIILFFIVYLSGKSASRNKDFIYVPLPKTLIKILFVKSDYSDRVQLHVILMQIASLIYLSITLVSLLYSIIFGEKSYIYECIGIYILVSLLIIIYACVCDLLLRKENKFIDKTCYIRENVISRETKILSVDMLCDELIKRGFILQDTIDDEYKYSVKFLQKITRDKVPLIDRMFIFNHLPKSYDDDFKELIKMTQTAIRKSNKKENIKRYKDRMGMYCSFVTNEEEKNIHGAISTTNYRNIIFLPIVVDVERSRVFHATIPVDKSSARGKALVQVSQLVSSIFYKEDCT